MVGSQTKIDLWAGEDISSCFASAALSISFLDLGLWPKRWQPLDLLSISLVRRGCLAAGSRKLSLQQATKEHLRTQTVCWLCMVAAAPCRRQAGLQQQSALSISAPQADVATARDREPSLPGKSICHRCSHTPEVHKSNGSFYPKEDL